MAKTPIEAKGGNKEMEPKNGMKWKHASASIWKPAPNDVLIGTYDGKDKLPDRVLDTMKKKNPKLFAEGDRDIFQHYFMVETGDSSRRYSLIGGTIFDGIIEDSPIEKGTLCRVEFLGQRETGTGNRANDWDVQYAE